MNKTTAALLPLLLASAAFAARPPDPTDGLPILVPSVTNLAARLVLPDFAAADGRTTGRVAYSNLLSGAVLDAPAFTVTAGGETIEAKAARDVPPGGAGEVEFTYTADGPHTVTLTMEDAAAPVAPSSVTADDAATDAPPFAAVLPVGPAPLTTGFLALNRRAAVAHRWTFDDGAISTEPAPVHTFATPGAHAVTLALTYADGTEESFTLEDAVTVWEASATARTRIVAVPVVSNAFAFALGETVDLDLKLTNALYLAFAADVRTVGALKKVRRFYAGVAGVFGADLQTTVATPRELLSGGLDGTVDFAAPPLMAWAGPKIEASATIGADLALRAKGRFARGVRFDGDAPRHVGGAVLEDFDAARDVACTRLFADATVFAGLEIGAAFGVESPGGGLSATFFSLAASAGVRGEARAEVTDAARSLALSVRPVVEVEFVPVSVTVFDVIDFTPIVKSKTLYEGPAWTCGFADAARGGRVALQTLPVAAGDGGAFAPSADIRPDRAASWLAAHNLVGRHATAADAAAVLRRPSGKTSAAGAPLAVWDDFVAGTSPTNAAERFTAAITIGADGKPRFTWSPDLGEARAYTVYGAETPAGPWRTPPTDADRFFKIGVSLP